MQIICRTSDLLSFFSGTNHKLNLVKSGLENIAKKSRLLHSSIQHRAKT